MGSDSQSLGRPSSLELQESKEKGSTSLLESPLSPPGLQTTAAAPRRPKGTRQRRDREGTQGRGEGGVVRGGAGAESTRGRSRRRARGAGPALTVARRSLRCGGFAAAVWAEGAVGKLRARPGRRGGGERPLCGGPRLGWGRARASGGRGPLRRRPGPVAAAGGGR